MLCLDKNDYNNFEFNDEYFEYLLNNNEEFDEEDLREFIDGWEIERNYGEDHRWDREVISICELLNKYYCIYWRQGLTEYQPDDFDDSQPFEVHKYNYEKLCHFHDWLSKENGNLIFTEMEND